MEDSSVKTNDPAAQKVQCCHEIERALAESLKLQSHYASLLNMYDGGARMTFASVEEWLDRLKMKRPPFTVVADLLAALEELVAEHGEPFNFHHETEGFNMARAAIRKAKGEA